MIFERHTFVGLTTTDLDRARHFWVDQLEFPVTDEAAGKHFTVDAGSLRLRVCLVDGDIHRSGSTDPVLGFKVTSLEDTLEALATLDVYSHRGPIVDTVGSHGELRDPDGRTIILIQEA